MDPAVASTVRYVRLAGTGDAIHTLEISQRDGDSSLLTLGPELSP